MLITSTLRFWLLGLLAFWMNGLAAQTANVQIIHNSPDPGAAVVDVYINAGAAPAVEDLAFRDATSFLALPAGATFDVGIAPGNSTGPGDIIATFPFPALADGENYVVMATGVLDPVNFDSSVNGAGIAFDLKVFTPAQQGSTNPANVDLAVYHGSPDAPAVDVLANNSTPPVVGPLSYGNFTGGYLSLPPAEYFLSVTPAGANSTIVATFQADLSGLAGGAAVVFASGFLDPAANQNGEAFGLFAALPDGTVVPLPAVDCDLGIISYTLWDGRHNQPVPGYDPIVDGMVIDLADLDVPSNKLNIQANVCTGFDYGSVGFELTGSATFSLFDNRSPFFLFRDNNNGSVFQWPDNIAPMPGDSYTLTATAFSSPAGAGDMGMGSSLSFSFVDSDEPAHVQVIHNSPDPAAASVDIYLNGGMMPAIDDLDFREATPFIDLPANTPLTIGVAPGNSTGPGDIIASFPLSGLAGGVKYVVMASGVLDPTAFDASVNSIGFDLKILAPARSSGTGNNVDLAAFHGSTDAPAVDVLANGGVLIPNLSFGEFSGYASVPAASYLLEVTPAGMNSMVVGAFEADLTGLAGGAAVVFASGFLDPAANQNGASFGLFAALPNGTVVEFLPPPPPAANVQIIHNSADPAAAVVDIYLDGAASPAVEDLAFREATSFLALPAGTPFDVGIAPGNSTGPGDIIATFPFPALADDENYVVMATGVLDPASFDSSVNGAGIAFDLKVFTPAQQASANPANVDIAVYHGSTDAPAVDVLANNSTPPVVGPISYGNFTAGYLGLPPAEYFLSVTPGGANSTIVATFLADLRGLAGGAALVFASGFLDPAANQSGEAFGLFAALPDGTVVPLPAVNCDLGIVSFSLWDGKNNVPIPGFDPIPDGAVIDLADLPVPSNKLNIEANVCTGFPYGSVVFDLSGSANFFQNDNRPPFFLFRDNANGSVFQWPGNIAPEDGDSFSLIATAYSSAAGAGSMGMSDTIAFSFVDSGSMRLGQFGNGQGGDLRLYPNPSEGQVSLEWMGDLAGERLQVRIMSQTGQTLRLEELRVGKVRTFDLSDLPQGLYLIQVQGEGINRTEKLMLR